ncbi:MAG: tRNA (mo5U34)-methyltransferase [Woeseiaceae bacterium]|jgi:tRNA (mo5U34)-methyltransferase|tara:strand:+ start:2002 stop:2970 length:969 start_codon:yes stop_codon:yes gene_type:complete
MPNLEKFFLSQEKHNNLMWAREIDEIVNLKIKTTSNGNQTRWSHSLKQLPNIKKQLFNLDTAVISNKTINLTSKEKEITRKALKELSPWRKGPFLIDDIFINSEWQSNMKWDRIKEMVKPLEGKMILDVGCGNGYYSLRMLGDGAKSVIGIDPSMLFMMQFKAITHFMRSVPVFLLPLKFEELPCNMPIFDTAFSMGVLYHQRSPLEHLNQLYGALKKNGELILETIIFPGNDTYFRNENGRYAQMPNVWHLPNIKELYSWLKLTGFKNIKKGRIEITSTDEQRSTEWMTSHSLSNALDPDNKKLTIEGFPAPHRIIIACNK